MTKTYYISIGDASNAQLQQIASKSNMSPEDLARSYVLSGLQNAKFQGVRYLAACVTTAAIVLIGVWLLSVSLPSPSISPTALDWIRKLILLFAPWPLTILLALWIVARSETSFPLLLGLFGTLRKIKLFGAEIELNEQTKQRIQSAANEIELALREYKARADKEIARIVARYQIEQALSNFIDSASVRQLTPERDSSFRCTIHIPDPIRDGRLYQLVDYCPSGQGKGREFSVRFGIIGKVWRTENAMLENDLLHLDGERTHEKEMDKIMSDWGMDRREAEGALKHRAYFCFPLIHEHRKVGLLYMDAKKQNSFNKQKEDEVISAAQKALGSLVARVLDESATVSLNVELT